MSYRAGENVIDHSYCEADLVRSAKANVRFFIEIIIGLAIGIGVLGMLGSTLIGSISCLGGCLGCEECLETAACADECVAEMGCEECAEECDDYDDYDDGYYGDGYYGDGYYGDGYYGRDMGCWEELTAENLQQANECATCEGIDCFGRQGCFASDGCGDCEHCAGTMYYSITVKAGDTEKKLEINEDKTTIGIYYPSNVSSSYYRFKGYYDKEEGGTQYVDASGTIVKKLKNKMTLYGRYEEYRVGEEFIFELRLAALGMPDETISLQVGGSMSLIPIAPEKEGYDFVGWYLDGELVYQGNIKEGESFHLYTFGFSSDVYNGTVYTLTPKYTPKKYVVTFNVDGSQYRLEAAYGDTFGDVYSRFYYDYYSSLPYEESFFGWGVSDTTAPEDKVTNTTRVEKDTVLYAIFRQPIQFRFYYNRNSYDYNYDYINVKLYEGQENISFNDLEELAVINDESTYPGYKFIGWFSSASGSSDDQAISGISNVSLSSNTVYYARWKETDYTLEYYVMDYEAGVLRNDFNETYAMSNHAYNLVAADKVRHNVGYNFIGWCTTEECWDTPIMSLNAGTYGNMKLYAKFEPKSYGFNLVAAPGTVNGGAVATDSVLYGNSKDLSVPDREGYDFLGWYYGEKKVADENGHIDKFTFASLGLENNQTTESSFEGGVRIQLNAKWEIKKFTVSFVVDGYTIEEQTIEWNGNATKPSNPTKEGYTFNYWMKEDSSEFVFSTQIKKDWTITAKFTINKYTVAFIIQNVPTTINNVEWGTKLADVVAKIPVSKYPDETRYKLIGWYASMDSSALKYNDNTLIKENTTIYAHFEEALAIYFAEISTTKYWFVGSKVTFPEANKTGYTFVGWCTDEGLTSTPITITQEVKVTADMDEKTYYPKFKAIPYNIYYMVDGVEYDRDTYTIAEPKTLIAPGDSNEPKKTGYTFTGWTLNGAKVTQIVNTTEDKTLIAQFTANTYTITLLDEDGSQLYDNNFNAMKKSVVFDKNFNLGTPPSVKTGYHFVGWSWAKGSSETVTYDTGASKGVYKIGKDQNAYAVYEKNEYTFTWVGGDQGDQKTTQKHFDTVVKLPIAPAKVGYTFVGWYADSSYSTEYNVAHEVTGPETIYAKFTINSYTIDFMIGDDVVYTTTLVYDSSLSTAMANAQGYVDAYEDETKGIFQYWQTAAGKAYNSTSKVPAEHLTLKATFDMPVYAHFIERSGVEKTYGPYYYTEGDKISSYTPYRNGYTFNGWYKDNAQYQNFPITLSQNTTAPITYNFYANWQAEQYTIDYYIDGVYSHSEEYSMSEADNGGYALYVPTKTGHIFSNWKINNTGVALTEINNEGVEENNKTYGNLKLYGTFEAATYTITFISGGEIVKTIYVKYGDSLQSQNSWIGNNGSKLPPAGNGFLGFQDQYGNQVIDENGNWINGGTYIWDYNITLTAWWY